MMLSGTHMELVDEVWLGDRAARGEILHRAANRVDVRFRLAKNFPAGRYRIHASHRGEEMAIPTELRVSSLPEITVSKPALTQASAQPIQPSVVLNGVIEQPKNSHFFRFDAKAGERYMFRAESMKLGYHLDPTINLLDSEGKSLAFEDDLVIDERSDEYQLDCDLSYSFQQSGTYYVAIRDGMYRGGDQLVYRLTVQRMAPDFMAELREPVNRFTKASRELCRCGFAVARAGTAPVEVWAEGLPAVHRGSTSNAAPKDSVVKDTCGVDRTIDGTLVFLPVHVDQTAPGSF